MGERKSKSYLFVTYFDFFRGKKISHKNNTIIRTIELFPQFESLINKIFIKKKIPTQSGLGGGSSNAGTILRLIKNIFPYASIEKAAQEIGSDVSFFLNPVPTWVTGTGDKTKRLEIQTELFRKITFLLIFPPFGASTKNIFSLFKNKFSRSTNFFSKKKLTLRYFFKYLMVAKNDLEPIVINKFPFLAQVLEKLAETAPLFFSITGSGTTCFAIYESELKAKKSYKALYAFCRKNNCRSILAKTYTS